MKNEKSIVCNLRQSIREREIPFTITREVPNSDTMAAIKEFDEFKKNLSGYKKYSSFSELLDEVRADA